MGEAWSCPCGVREERKVQVKTGKAPVRRKAAEPPDLSFLQTRDPYKIAFVPTGALEAFFSEICIEKHLSKLFPHFVFQNPLDVHSTVVLFMPFDLCQDRCTSQHRFKVFYCTFPGLQEEVSCKHLSIAFSAFDREGKLEVIGAVPYENGIKVVYGQRAATKSVYTLSAVEIKEDFTASNLRSIVSAQSRQANAFRFAVALRERIFAVFEKGVADTGDYVAAPFDLTLRMEFLRGLPQTIEAQGRDFSFEGACVQTTTKTMLLVFKPRE